MKRFLKNILILAIPLMVYLLIILLVDPFNYLNFSKLVNDKIKYEISCEVAPHMYKLLDYNNNPKRNLVIGDSRAGGLYHCMDCTRWSNLAYGGASIKEMVQTFWWVADNHKMDTILIDISLNLYNKYNKRFYVEETIEAQKNFLSYAFYKSTFRSAFLILKSYCSKQKISINEVSMTKEEFWQFQLNDTPEKFYKKMAYPDNYYSDLVSISEYCSKNDITLIFWIPPTHIDFQNCLEKYNIEEKMNKFLEDIKSIGTVFDFNYSNEITRDKECFRDPLHFTHDIAIRIRRELTGGKQFIAIHSIPETIP